MGLDINNYTILDGAVELLVYTDMLEIFVLTKKIINLL